MEGDEDEEVQLEDGDEDEDDEDDPFDRVAAEQRRQKRRLAGGDHIQVAVMPPPVPSISSPKRVVADEDSDFSESHMFGRTEPGARRPMDEEEDDAEELDYKTYGSVDDDDSELEADDDEHEAGLGLSDPPHSA